jgi:hypothetical protein
MLKFTSVRSSEPQVRNPTGLKKQSPNSGFHKTITNLLEPIPLPFPSYQLVKESSASILGKHQFYAWKRPAHLRPNWLVLSDLGPAVLVDPRDKTRVFSIKFPFDSRKVQHSGPIVCECAYDTQEATLYVWDILVWEKEEIYTKQNYSQRWKLLQHIATTILDINHPNSEIRIQLPTWESLATLSIPEKQYAIEFQPEKAGQRRFVWIQPKQADTFKPQTFHEREMISHEAKPMFVEDPEPAPAPVSEPISSAQSAPEQTPKVQKTATMGTLTKDTRSKLPDAYILIGPDGSNLGLPAIRRIELSKQLRTHFTTNTECHVLIQWYEPFQKYEIKQVLVPAVSA